MCVCPCVPMSLCVCVYVCVLCVFQQQDVCEFTHKLLDWLEDAFQVKAEESR